MRTGELAREAGVNIETLRYYERRGLLPPPERAPNGYRVYTAAALDRIRFIKRAQGLGFSLEEIEELMSLRPAKGRQRQRVRRIAETKLETIESKLAELEGIREALRQLVKDCEAGCDDADCPIIEALSQPGKVPCHT
ncbi:MAG: MerR family transcriptional regulator [Myxococcales bacterium]|nr:MerR family transcriptional regulator [Myxococcales bacterium]